jgi:hypothetical protein
MKLETMTEEAVRKAYSGFLPPKIAAQMKASRAPTQEELDAARALLEKAGVLPSEQTKRRPRLEAAE